MKKILLIAALASAASLSYATPAAQVVGATTTVGVTTVESTQVALGWSVKKTLLGKPVYNEFGTKVGKIDDLIISPSRAVSYMIIGAGGFVGIGRHDVAIPVSQIQNQSGKLVMAGATKEAIKALPNFEYADHTAMRTDFVAQAEAEQTKAKDDIDVLKKRAADASVDIRKNIETQVTFLESELKSAEGKLSELKSASAKRWKDYEANVVAANLRLRKSIDKVLSLR